MRRVSLSLLTILLLAGSVLFAKRRKNSTIGEPEAVQWPFESAELRSLMRNVVAEQRARIATIEDQAGRNRAQAFLDYYERRRQAAAS